MEFPTSVGMPMFCLTVIVEALSVGMTDPMANIVHIVSTEADTISNLHLMISIPSAIDPNPDI
jgi:hypothetical protein